MIGEAISHYRILSKLGAGGMGEVYLAQETKLDRKVALKILPADVAAHPDRMKRFVQEASAAAPSHPNIAQIHETGIAGTGSWLTVVRKVAPPNWRKDLALMRSRTSELMIT